MLNTYPWTWFLKHRFLADLINNLDTTSTGKTLLTGAEKETQSLLTHGFSRRDPAHVCQQQRPVAGETKPSPETAPTQRDSPDRSASVPASS